MLRSEAEPRWFHKAHILLQRGYAVGCRRLRLARADSIGDHLGWLHEGQSGAQVACAAVACRMGTRIRLTTIGLRCDSL
jgi:hypothetical protein